MAQKSSPLGVGSVTVDNLVLMSVDLEQAAVPITLSWRNCAAAQHLQDHPTTIE